MFLDLNFYLPTVKSIQQNIFSVIGKTEYISILLMK